MSRKKAEQAEVFHSLRSEKGQKKAARAGSSGAAGEPRAASTQHAPEAGGSAPNATRSARASIAETEARTSPHSSAASAAVTVNLADVRLMGAEAALVWAVMQQLGRYDRAAASIATGIPSSTIRQLWARVGSYGYRLPEHT